ncbi:MAG: histidine kinase [Agarilytica sp.]
MNISIELTLYPFKEDPIPPITACIEKLNSFEGLQVETFPTATIIFGDYDVAMDALKTTIAWSYSTFGRCVFVAKFLPNYKALG